jgi:excisionase family DNA binding protein
VTNAAVRVVDTDDSPASTARQAADIAAELTARLRALVRDVTRLTEQLAAPPRRTAPTVMLTPEEAAEALRVSRTVVFTLIRDGALHSVKIGASRRIPAVALAEYADRLDQKQAAEHANTGK